MILLSEFYRQIKEIKIFNVENVNKNKTELWQELWRAYCIRVKYYAAAMIGLTI